MLDFISGFIICTLSILGVVETARILLGLLMKPESENAVLLIKAEENNDIEYIVKSWMTYSKWHKNTKQLKIIILLCSSTSQQQREICRRLCKDFDCVKAVACEHFENLYENI